MRRRDTLLVFAKAPALGRVKTRLARGIGALAALAFYRRTLATVLRRLSDPRWRTVLAVAPDRTAARARLWPVRGPRVGQGAGDLGRRMARAFCRAEARRVVIVGADIPDLAACHIAQAFRALGHAEAVFGPAADGGYWLVGMRPGRRRLGMFDGVRWSSDHALADTLARLDGRRIAFLEVLEDVDDLRSWRRRGAARSGPARVGAGPTPAPWA